MNGDRGRIIMSCINALPVKADDYVGLLSKFPEQHRDKLRCYTGEELYYIYCIALFKPRKTDGTMASSGDAFYTGLKYKLFRWLKGEDRYGIHASALAKIGSKFRNGFNDFVIESLTQDMIDSFASKINGRRVG